MRIKVDGRIRVVPIIREWTTFQGKGVEKAVCGLDIRKLLL